MLRLRPTYEELLTETMTKRLKILPEKQKRTQQGILLDDVDFDDFDLSKYDRRNKATQTDMFNEPSNYSIASSRMSREASAEASNRSVKTAIEGNDDRTQESREAREVTPSRQTSASTGESMDDVRYRTRMSIADDLATMARVGGNIIYYTGQGIGQGINMAVDTYNRLNEGDEEDDVEPEPPIDEEVFEQTQRLMRRGASRSRSPEERASGSNEAMRLLRRGASRSRSTSPTKKPKSK